MTLEPYNMNNFEPFEPRRVSLHDEGLAALLCEHPTSLRVRKDGVHVTYSRHLMGDVLTILGMPKAVSASRAHYVDSEYLFFENKESSLDLYIDFV